MLSNSSCRLFTVNQPCPPTEKVYINYEAIKQYPQPKGYVSDFDSVLTEVQVNELTSTIAKYDVGTTNEIAIVTVANFAPYNSLKDLTTDLGNYWGVGQRCDDNGLIIMLCKPQRSVWIGTGLGTEQVLTDDIVKSIVDTKMIPQFRKSDYYKGVSIGLKECIQAWDLKTK